MTSHASDRLCSAVCLNTSAGRVPPTCCSSKERLVHALRCAWVCQSATWDSCFPFPPFSIPAPPPPPPPPLPLSPLLHPLLLPVWLQREANDVADRRLDVKLLAKWIRWIPADKLDTIWIFYLTYYFVDCVHWLLIDHWSIELKRLDGCWQGSTTIISFLFGSMVLI